MSERDDTRFEFLSSRRASVLGWVAVAALAATTVGWGAFASISGAVIAEGEVRTLMGDQLVEHVDGGTVVEILARDGDRVEKDDVLVRLDPTDVAAQIGIFEAQAAELAAERARLEAEIRGAATIAWGSGLVERARADPDVAGVLEGHRKLFEARRLSRQGETAQLHTRIEQTERQIAGLRAVARAARTQIDAVRGELGIQRGLLARGMAVRGPVLNLEREAARLEGQIGETHAAVAAARGRVAEIEVQLLRIDRERIETAHARAREVEARQGETHKRLEALRARLVRLAVRAPVTGTVFGLRLGAIGEVVEAAEPILRIVPEGAELVALAHVAPVDVDQVRAGQRAVLRFPAFATRRTPEYRGEVVRVGADASHDPRTGASWYEVAVRPQGPIGAAPLFPSLDGLWRGAERVSEPARLHAQRPPAPRALAPGMPVEVHLRTSARPPLAILTQPITDFFSRALRER